MAKRLWFIILAIIIVISTACVKKYNNYQYSEKEIEYEENVVVEIEEKEYIQKFSDEDLYHLAVAICKEAGGENEEVQLLVANVIMNRVNSSIYPDTIYDVITQKGQYGTMYKDEIEFPKWATNSVQEQCYNSARIILEGNKFCPENVLYQAGFKQGSGVYKEYPGYYFCYE